MLFFFQSERKYLFYFPELANETVGPYAMQWRGYKAHYITGGYVHM